MTIWFTADTHFGHANIINYCERPYKNATEMDEWLIRNWNSYVQPCDTVYHLGDFCLSYKEEDLKRYIQRLNGQIHLILGNHDRIKLSIYSKYFASVSDIKTIKVPDEDSPSGKQGIILCHYAMRVWKNSHHGYYHLYGHSHGTLPDDPCARSFDVGVDAMAQEGAHGKPLMIDYRPISYEEVKQVMWKKKTWKPKDHHE